MKLDVMTDFNTKKSRQPWVRGNISGFFTSLIRGFGMRFAQKGVAALRPVLVPTCYVGTLGLPALRCNSPQRGESELPRSAW
ncbi:hypothetical protein [Methylomonas sp. DH-1]|uniref:hypothetical protein n=1 Tax=Methylomonas sp. (strain DH-1) TaxID=1727196 RepID=UPI000A54E929|nr:hypothetical protein [Methylomonas sp. DH-1]